MTTTTSNAAVREALLQARADLDDALDLLDEVDELPPEVAGGVFGAVEAPGSAPAEPEVKAKPRKKGERKE
jgi:hypothetical protein